MIWDNYIDTVKVKKEYYASGDLWLETPYVNGKRHGVKKEYYDSGFLWEETPYVNGMRHGIERGYYKERVNICYLVLYNKDREVASVTSYI